MKSLFPVSAALLMVVSCSIKEDRMECPCRLELTVSGGCEKMVSMSMWGTGIISVRTIEKEKKEQKYEMSVSRNVETLTVYSGVHRGTVWDDRRIVVPEGEEMDEIYAGTTPLFSACEDQSASVELHKQFAFLHLNIVSTGTRPSRLSARVRGNVCGIDVLSLSPVPGAFSMLIFPVIGDYYRICLPRQLDGTLELELFNGETEEGKVTVPIGQALVQAGYDWTEPDLKDVFMDIDYAKLDLKVKINEWSDVDIWEKDY